MSWAEPLFGL